MIHTLILLASVSYTWQASVLRVDDGDTIKVHVPALEGTPFSNLSLRINGIDTPESHKPPGKCIPEVKAGLAAAAYARTLMKSGDTVTVQFTGFDKYGGRIDGNLLLSDGRDFGGLMLTSKMARPYKGKAKPNWCALLKVKPA